MLNESIAGRKYDNQDDFERFKNFVTIVLQKKMNRFNPKFYFFAKEDKNFFDMEILLFDNQEVPITVRVKFRRFPTKTDLVKINRKKRLREDGSFIDEYIKDNDGEDTSIIDLYIHMSEKNREVINLDEYYYRPEFKKTFRMFEDNLDKEEKIFFLGEAVFNALKEEFPVDYYIYFDTTVEINTDQIYQHSDGLIKLLTNNFVRLPRKFTFVLGAGVSKRYDMPMWNQLLNNYLIQIKRRISYNEDYIFEKIGDTSLIKAQFVVDNFSQASSRKGREYAFCRDLKKLFYSKNKYKQLTKSTLRSVVRCIDRNFDKSDGVLTYNYDDLLERTIEVESNRSFQTIYKDEDLENKDVNIYHVHGYLPRKGNLKSEHANSIILSEEKYNFLLNNPMSWQISNQLTRFRENLCILVGLSISDPSLRRLLESVKMSNSTRFHYAIMAKESSDHVPTLQDILAVTKHFERIGIHIIWVDNYSDIPAVIDSL